LIFYAYMRAGGDLTWRDGAFLAVVIAVPIFNAWVRSLAGPLILSPIHRPERQGRRQVELDPVGIIVPSVVVVLQALFLQFVGLTYSWVRVQTVEDRNRVRRAPLLRQSLYSVLPLITHFLVVFVAARLLTNRITSTDLLGQTSVDVDTGIITEMLAYTVVVSAFYFVIGLFPLPGQPVGDLIEAALSEKWRDRFDRFRPWANISVAVMCIFAARLVDRIVSYPINVIYNVVGLG
jgi:hypothetical protein